MWNEVKKLIKQFRDKANEILKTDEEKEKERYFKKRHQERMEQLNNF